VPYNVATVSAPLSLRESKGATVGVFQVT
jgi:hypothetical protein